MRAPGRGRCRARRHRGLEPATRSAIASLTAEKTFPGPTDNGRKCGGQRPHRVASQRPGGKNRTFLTPKQTSLPVKLSWPPGAAQASFHRPRHIGIGMESHEREQVSEELACNQKH